MVDPNCNETGLLETIPVIVATGEHRPSGVEGHLILQKPVRMDVLLAAMESVLDSRCRTSLPARQVVPWMELTLYLMNPSHESETARRNLSRILWPVEAGSVSLVLRDLGSGDEGALREAEADRIVVVPTLVRSSPGPKLWIAGTLSKLEYVWEMLRASDSSGKGNACRAASIASPSGRIERRDDVQIVL